MRKIQHLRTGQLVIHFSLTAAAMGVFSTQALADQGDIYASANVGVSILNADDLEEDLEEAFPNQGLSIEADGGGAFGVSLGYGFTSTLSAELELTASSAEYTLRGPGGSVSLDADIRSIGAYVAYRSLGDFYFGGRLGVVQSTIDYDDNIDDDSDSGLGIGANVGYRISEQLEVDGGYTIVASDIAYFLLSGRYYF